MMGPLLIGPLGVPEMIILMVIVLLIFGAKRLPEIGSSLGKGIRNFKTSITDGSEKKEAADGGEEGK
jgi:sec-independent protein translocase protein TatA